MALSPATLRGSLRGKHAIVTGGSRGIGAAIARRFAAEGASITLVARDKARLEEVRASLPATVSGEENAEKLVHSAVVADVRNHQIWDQLVSKMRPDLGLFNDILDVTWFTIELGLLINRVYKNNVDILVNAAGIAQNSFLFRTNPVQIREVLETNLYSTILACQVLSKRMMEQRDGCIINIASLLATHAGRGASVYAASKAGIVGLTRSLAWEVGRFGVRVNVILPGYIDTDMTTSMDTKGELRALIPMGRLGRVEEVADAAEFLATNTYAHNTVLNLDGGLSAT